VELAQEPIHSLGAWVDDGAVSVVVGVTAVDVVGADVEDTS